MSEIKIYCDQGHSRRFVATMRKEYDADMAELGRWVEQVPTPRAYLRERAEWESQRRKERPASADPSSFDLNDWLDGPNWEGFFEAREKLHYRVIENGKSAGLLGSADNPAKRHTTYDFRCDKCAGRSRRVTNVPRRADDFHAVLDLLDAQGIKLIQLDTLQSAVDRHARQ